MDVGCKAAPRIVSERLGWPFSATERPLLARREPQLDCPALGLVNRALQTLAISPVGELFPEVVKGWNRVRVTDGAPLVSARDGVDQAWRCGLTAMPPSVTTTSISSPGPVKVVARSTTTGMRSRKEGSASMAQPPMPCSRRPSEWVTTLPLKAGSSSGGARDDGID
jgi:hypothetical protein